MVEFGAEVAPYRNSRTGLPPGGEGKAQHVQGAQHGCRAHPEAHQETHSNEEFDHADQISEKYRMRQHQIRQNRLVEAHNAGLDKSLEILLEPAVSELGAEDLVLAENQKENRRDDANDRDGFG